MRVRAGAGNQLTWLTMIALLLFVLDAEARSIPRPWPSNRNRVQVHTAFHRKRSSTSKWAIGPCSSCCAYRSRCRQMQTICPRMIMWPPKNAEMHLHPGMVLARLHATDIPTPGPRSGTPKSVSWTTKSRNFMLHASIHVCSRAAPDSGRSLRVSQAESPGKIETREALHGKVHNAHNAKQYKECGNYTCVKLAKKASC
jgi:hypothetical protein